MDLLTVNPMWTTKPCNHAATNLGNGNSSFICGNFNIPYNSPKFRPSKTHIIWALANRKSVKKLKRQRKADTNLAQQPGASSLNQRDESGTDNIEYSNKEPSSENLESQENSITIPSRSAVLHACTVTSGLIAALGVVIRQVSHVASAEGLPVLDCSTEISFSFEMWHLQLIAGLVILISSCRYLLLNTWQNFAKSSEAANQQVLSSLEPLDYMIVAFLPGISEELLFRGALLPLFGVNWKSAMLVGALFGVLHLGSGRKYSFAIWATFVGFAYGYATIVSSSLLVPMASHAANNLVGGLLWRYSSKLPD